MSINKQFLLFLCFLSLMACKEESEVEKAVSEMNLSVKVDRFDQVLYGAKPDEIANIRQNYPEFFSDEVPDSIYIQKITDSIYHELYLEVQKQFPDLQQVKSETENLLKHVKYYFPNEPIPTKLTSLISEMDFNNKVIYTDSIMLVSLDLYLGSEHRYYVGEFYDYQRLLFTPSQILPDLADALVRNKTQKIASNTFVGDMISEGKIQYIKQALLPKIPSYEIIGYSEVQWNWCLANEKYMWQYFVDNNLLFDNNPKNKNRFILEAPFSKFYLEIDAQSPGRVGIWLGWQIVKSYMENNKVSIPELLELDAKTIFENAKYKPKK
jgi:gliding motility-associated lipoprotein GldB